MTNALGAALPASLLAWTRVNWDLALVAGVIVYFLLRTLYYALTINPFVPPDEATHMGRVLAFAASDWLPTDSLATYKRGLITHVPNLYYLLMGKLLHLNLFDVPDLVFVRLLNVPLGLLTVVYAWRWISLFTPCRVARVLFVVMLTNTLMFSFLFGTVNYDNLTNLLAAMSVYYLFAFIIGRNPVTLAKFLLCLLLGALTKEAFLPLAAILCIVLVIHERRRLTALPEHVIAFLYPLGVRRALLCIALVVATATNLGLYGLNLLHYGNLIPSADQVVGLQNAMQYPVFARDYIVQSFRNGELQYEQAIELANRFLDPIGRIHMLRLLEIARTHELARRPAMNPLAYISWWIHQTVATGAGLLGHRSLIKNKPYELYPYFVVGILALLVFVWKWRPNDCVGTASYAALIILAYVMILMWLVNYPIYVNTANPYIALQGRYTFVVLLPFLGLIAHYLVAYLPGRMQITVAIAVGAFFVEGDFLFFLMHAGPEWYTSI